MLKPAQPKQSELEMVTLEQLVPADHLLRQIHRHIDFSLHTREDRPPVLRR